MEPSLVDAGAAGDWPLGHAMRNARPSARSVTELTIRTALRTFVWLGARAAIANFVRALAELLVAALLVVARGAPRDTIGLVSRLFDAEIDGCSEAGCGAHFDFG